MSEGWIVDLMIAIYTLHRNVLKYRSALNNMHVLPIRIKCKKKVRKIRKRGNRGNMQDMDAAELDTIRDSLLALLIRALAGAAETEGVGVEVREVSFDFINRSTFLAMHSPSSYSRRFLSRSSSAAYCTGIASPAACGS